MSRSSTTSDDPEVALKTAETLPAEWYTSVEILAAEKSRILHKTWQYAGETGQVTRPGDFFKVQFGDIPIVVTRDARGALHAMANVCRHRGSEVVLETRGNRMTLQCHYHGWTYDLDGKLRAA